ncbi:19776_t:CDS:2 [Gigaspora margarita]|uniref:19776_t:CDS:1 n=1 Tax=Gigaspora margarita TaxID=4874 RepID=A0ABM8VYH2_GIGMA|nr:19776_t:CDS:2 [Gigaspora margarita]
MSYMLEMSSLNSSDSSSPGSSGSPAHSLSVRYPLQEIKQQNDTKANFLEVIDDYPNIYVTRFEGNRKKNTFIKFFVLKLSKVIYTITWDSKEKKKSVTSDKSASNMATLFLQNLSNNNKTTFSGVVLFGFDLECLENRRINNQKNQIRKNKPFHQLNSKTQKNIRLKALAHDINKLSVKPTFNKKLKVNTDITIRKRIELVIHSLGISIFKFKEPETPKGR